MPNWIVRQDQEGRFQMQFVPTPPRSKMVQSSVAGFSQEIFIRNYITHNLLKN